MTCKHPCVAIKVEWVANVAATSFADVEPPINHTFPLAMGPVSIGQGYWTRAHIHARCIDCRHETWTTSADWRKWPRWLHDAWIRLVHHSDPIREIHKHYRMFEVQEEPCQTN